MKRRGFTLIELLVVIGIIALLVSILMPALGKAKELANQVKCASQLNALGKGNVMYMNDFDGQACAVGDPDVPTLGAQSGTVGWYKDDQTRWYSLDFAWGQDWNGAMPGTVGGSLFLLVKHADVVPEMFLCPSTDDRQPDLDFAVSENPDIKGWDDLRDFQGMDNLSYSYQYPWRPYALNETTSGAKPVMADKNPSFDKEPIDPDGFILNPDSGTFPKHATATIPGDADYSPNWTDQDGLNLAHGNSKNHKTKLQEVLFADTHVKKCNEPIVGINKDNIYTVQTDGGEPIDRIIGEWGALDLTPLSRTDSFLCN